MLILVGISLIGVMTATIAACFVGPDDDAESDLVSEIRALRAEVSELCAERLPDWLLLAKC